MVSHSQKPQSSTALHSSEASNSSGSTMAVAVESEVLTETVTHNDHKSALSSSTSLQLLRRSRNTVAKIKLSNLFRGKSQPPVNENDGIATAAEKPTDSICINNPGANDNTMFTSVIVTTTDQTTTNDEKQSDLADRTVWMESLYHSQIPTGQVVEDNDNLGFFLEQNDLMKTTAKVPKDQDTVLQQEQDEFTSNAVKTTSTTGPFCTDTAGLPFFDRMCHIGGRTLSSDDDSETIVTDQRIAQKFHNTLPDDPSIQESIECVFMAQQDSILRDEQKQQQQQQQQQRIEAQSTLKQLQVSDGEKPNNDHGSFNSNMNHSTQTPPSTIHQSLLKNRSISRLPIQFQRDVISRSPRSTDRLAQQKLLNMSQQRISPLENDMKTSVVALAEGSTTVKPKIIAASSIDENSESNPEASPTISANDCVNVANSASSVSCACCQHHVPMIEPQHWPQRPLLLRPTPNGGTRVKGIRFASSKEYLWKSNDSNVSTISESSLTWPQALRKHWEKDTDASHLPSTPTLRTTTTSLQSMCSKCMILPINNGKELPGESLVSDFESDWFIGTILIRLKDCHGTTIPNVREQDESGGYFYNLHRRYQVVIRGQFKQSIPWTECITGFQYV
jgi:Protein of unknown function (DUF1769)